MDDHRPPGTPGNVTTAILVFAGLALAISGYLVLHGDIQHAHLPGCSGETQCAIVLGSRWAKWGPLPIAVLGVVCYITLALAAALVRTDMPRKRCRKVWAAMVIQSLAGIAFVVWLVAIQWVALHHFCMYCLSAHLFGAVAFFLVLRHAPVWRVLPGAAWKLGSASAAVAALLIGSHIFLAPDLMAVETSGDLILADASSAEFAGGTIQIGKKPEPRTIRLLEGNLVFPVEDVPLMGGEDAEHIVVELFDYPCPSCRELYAKLKDFEARYQGRIALVPLPVPMNRDCNPGLKRTLPMFNDSCTYARLSMAVCATDRGKFGEFHDWMMTGAWPPPVEEARARAEQLIGKEALADALAEKAGERWINDGLNVYRFIRGKSIPKLIAGDTVISYSGSSRRTFFTTLEEVLGLAPADTAR